MFKEIMKKNKVLVSIVAIFQIISSLSLVYAGYSLSFLFGATSYTDNQLVKLFQDAINVTLIWCVALFFLYVKSILIAHINKIFRNNLRENIAKKLVSLEYQEFNKRDSGNYVSWLSNDVQQISQQAFSSFFTLIDNAATTIFSLIAMVNLNIYIGITAICLFIFSSITPKFLTKKMESVTKEKSEGQEVFIESIKETIMGYNIFKLYNLFSEFESRIVKSSEKIEALCFKYSKTEAFVSVISAGINLIGQVSLIIITLYLSINNLTPIGAVLSVGNLAGSFFSGVGAFIEGISILKASIPIFDKFKLEYKSNKNVDISELETISIKNLSFSYSNSKILDSLSMKFEAGKKYALIGESGSGKSTLSKILMGFLDNYTGEILFNNIELKNITLNTLYNQISYIDQNVYLFNGTIKSNILLGEDFSNSEMELALKKSCLYDLINKLPDGLDTVVAENGKNFSGGQRQRIALARALIRNIKFFIIDEGTSSLDEHNALEIEENLISPNGLCVIIITHNLRESISNNLEQIYKLC